MGADLNDVSSLAKSFLQIQYTNNGDNVKQAGVPIIHFDVIQPLQEISVKSLYLKH